MTELIDKVLYRDWQDTKDSINRLRKYGSAYSGTVGSVHGVGTGGNVAARLLSEAIGVVWDEGILGADTLVVFDSLTEPELEIFRYKYPDNVVICVDWLHNDFVVYPDGWTNAYDLNTVEKVSYPWNSECIQGYNGKIQTTTYCRGTRKMSGKTEIRVNKSDETLANSVKEQGTVKQENRDSVIASVPTDKVADLKKQGQVLESMNEN